MNRQQFIDALTSRLAYLPLAETEKFIDFYIEAIDDRIEDGMSEEAAVAAMGSIDSVVHAIEAEIPLSTIVKQRVKSSRERSERAGEGHSAWWIVLAVIGSPIWLTIACVLFAVVISVFAAVLVVIVSVFVVLLALGISAAAMLVYSVTRIFAAGFFSALLCLGMAMIMAGLTAALLGPCVMLAKLMVKLPLLFWRWIKGLVIGRREDR